MLIQETKCKTFWQTDFPSLELGALSHVLVVLVLESRRQEDQEFQACLDYLSLCLKRCPSLVHPLKMNSVR